MPASVNSGGGAVAAGSSFYAGMRLLPKNEREAMFAIYAFCRAVDDIADEGTAARDARRAALNAWRLDIETLYKNKEAERASYLAPHVTRFHLGKDDFLAVIDGMEMDVVEDIRAPDLKTLDLYCDRVASAVGRLSVKTFGMDQEPGIHLAHHLGRALQKTNILRDLDEDAKAGRLYLPREYLDAAGIPGADPSAVIANPAIDAAARLLARDAHAHYREAGAIMRSGTKGRLAAPRLMGAVYSRILGEMEKDGWAPPRRRVKLSRGRLLWIVLRHGLFG